MQEQGIIEEILPNGEAVVIVKRSAACEGCAQKGFCWSENADILRIKIRPSFEPKVGQTVKLDIQTKNFLKYSFITYMIPVFTLILCSIIASVVAEQVGLVQKFWPAVGGLAGVGIGLLIVKLYSAKLGKKNINVIKISDDSKIE